MLRPVDAGYLNGVWIDVLEARLREELAAA